MGTTPRGLGRGQGAGEEGCAMPGFILSFIPLVKIVLFADSMKSYFQKAFKALFFPLIEF